MLKQAFLFLAIISVLLFACKTKEQSLNIVNIEKFQATQNYSNIYFLPKTVIRVNVEISQTVSKQGPYAQYAKSLLNINNIIEKDDIEWDIENIEFVAYPVPDTNQIYLLEQNDFPGLFAVSLTPCGLISSVNNQNKEKDFDFLNYINEKKAGTLNFNPEESVLNTNNMINFNDVPLLKEITGKKTLYAQAQALAEKIYILRDDRAAIIVGDGYTENMPDGLAMKEIIKELNKLERKYLSMFVGKQIERTYHYSFDFVPEFPKKTTQAILFRFSNQRGIVPVNDVSGTPAIIEINSQQNMKKVAFLNKRQNYLQKTGKIEDYKKGLFYRIPEMVTARLLIDEHVLAEKKLMIAQFGQVHALSPQYLNGKYIIDFYPALGSIKSIRTVNK